MWTARVDAAKLAQTGERHAMMKEIVLWIALGFFLLTAIASAILPFLQLFVGA